MRVCDDCFNIVQQSGGTPFQQAPDNWKPQQEEPEWHAPPASTGEYAPEASAPPSEHAGSGAYPDLNK